MRDGQGLSKLASPHLALILLRKDPIRIDVKSERILT